MGHPRIAMRAKVARLQSDLHDVVKQGVGRSDVYDTLSIQIHGRLSDAYRPGAPVRVAGVDGRDRYIVGGSVAALEARERDYLGELVDLQKRGRGDAPPVNEGAYRPEAVARPRPGDALFCEECGGVHDPLTGMTAARLADQRRGAHGSHSSGGRRARDRRTLSPSERVSRHAALGEFSEV